ncbi:hypothetical protein QVD17_27955 [Tagetes erecta]|uniref:Uncharacterized protein n=1 Tax=Tagetes erecta TaxID=13708 RepID=A0AAD8KC09_TARER|nr:hypothetical protein QVD17_27955 [Tagetes erecta]
MINYIKDRYSFAKHHIERVTSARNHHYRSTNPLPETTTTTDRYTRKPSPPPIATSSAGNRHHHNRHNRALFRESFGSSIHSPHQLPTI